MFSLAAASQRVIANPAEGTRDWPPGHSPVGQIGANLKIYGARMSSSTDDELLSPVRTVGYGASERDDPLHLLFLGQEGRVE